MRVLAALTATTIAVGALACSRGAEEVAPAALADEPGTLAYVTVVSATGDPTDIDSAVWVREPNGGTRAVATYPGEVLYSLFGSPAGSYIAVHAGAMLILDRDGELIMTLREASTFPAVPLASWSPNEDTFVYMYSGERDPPGGVEVVEVPSGRIVTPRALEGALLGMPSYAPDGRRFAAIEADGLGGRSERTTSIVVVDSEGDREILTTATAGSDISPLWSPDGEWVAYLAVDYDTPDDVIAASVFVVPASGGDSRFLVPAVSLSNQAWARDGQRITLSCVAEGRIVEVSDVCIVQMSDGAVTVLTDDGRSFGAAFSPDGRQIAYLRISDDESSGGAAAVLTYTLSVLDLASGESVDVATGVPYAGFTWLANSGRE